MSSRFGNLFLAVAAAAVSFTVGCSEAGSPVDASPARFAKATTTAGTTSDFTATGNLDIIARYRVKPQITIAWAKAWIGPAGGRLDFQGFSIIVPAGAVDKVTQFSIRLPVDPNGSERVVAEFEPHNVPFAVPVTIGFPLRGTTIEGSTSAHVVWWDDTWVDVGGAPSADGSQLFTQTPHFSQYGTTDQRSGSISVSGG